MTEHKNAEAENIKEAVSLGILSPLSGPEFHEKLNRPRHKQVNPLKVARMLMPNAF